VEAAVVGLEAARGGLGPIWQGPFAHLSPLCSPGNQCLLTPHLHPPPLPPHPRLPSARTPPTACWASCSGTWSRRSGTPARRAGARSRCWRGSTRQLRWGPSVHAGALACVCVCAEGDRAAAHSAVPVVCVMPACDGLCCSFSALYGTCVPEQQRAFQSGKGCTGALPRHKQPSAASALCGAAE
jgi:hypothetical protein